MFLKVRSLTMQAIGFNFSAVTRAHNVSDELNFHSKVSKLYVKVKFGDVKRQTMSFDANSTTPWNENIVL